MSDHFATFREEWSWPKILGETLTIIVGVFLGIQASNWNDERVQRAETAHVLRDLKPELGNLAAIFRSLTDYYAITRKYGDTAFAGWRNDPNVSDRDFVIAAYQASQNTFTGVNNNSWAEIFGSDRLRDINDQELRDGLSSLMTTDFTTFEKELFTDYRQHVREVIPEDVQDAIRGQCGDRRVGSLGSIALPPTCSLDSPDDRVHEAARNLRAHPELVGQLRWHFAAVATYVDNINNLKVITTRVLARMDKA